MEGFSLNNRSGRQERWATDGYRWVAAEPNGDGFDLWGYQDDTAEVVHLGHSSNNERLEKLAEQFLFG